MGMSGTVTSLAPEHDHCGSFSKIRLCDRLFSERNPVLLHQLQWSPKLHSRLSLRPDRRRAFVDYRAWSAWV